MPVATLRSTIEKTLFGFTLEGLLDKIRLLNKSVDVMSTKLDRDLASVRKDLRRLERANADARDGLFIIESDCISCQTCTEVAPDTFRMRDDGVAEVFNMYGSHLEKVHEAIQNCGGACIKLE